MKVALKGIVGRWDVGFALDKHMLSSVYLGEDQYGHKRFDNTRTEVGEATYQLKYRKDWTQVAPLAQAIAESVFPKLQQVGLLIPMPASTVRDRQPVTEVTRELGRLLGLPVFETLLVKAPGGKSLKNLDTKDEKIAALGAGGGFTVVDVIEGEGRWNAFMIGDLYHTGASMDGACNALKRYRKIDKIYVATLTWRGTPLS